MRIGYFGGTFDPPHRGHLAVAEAARDALQLDRVLLAPTGRQPLKDETPGASFADRLAMTELLCQGVRALEATAVDAPRPDGRPNYTIDALGRLQKSFGAGAQLFVVVGVDAFLGLSRWRDPAGLLAAAEWIVVSRPGHRMESVRGMELAANAEDRIHWLEDVSEPVSATEVRERLRERCGCEDVLTPEVLGYIKTHHLYEQ